MTTEIGYISGFQPNRINLASTKNVTVKMTFVGDGMSGKTQILITFGKLLQMYLQRIYSLSTNSIKTDLQQKSNQIGGKKKELHIKKQIFQNWAKRHGFLLRYGKTTWNITTISLDTETVGLENFEYTFPYVRNSNTYIIRILGNDVGGQNVFDHFRAVLGKMAGPDDNLIVVFDKSRELSCYNSIRQIKKVLGTETSDRRWSDESDISQIIYCGNKIDLEKHIQSQKWREMVLQSVINKITEVLNHGTGEYFFPSLIGEKESKKERIVNYKIENNQITFPDLEALIYNAIRESDILYGTQLMSEVNTKALCREIAAQLVYTQKTMEIEEENDQVERIWEKLGSLLFQSRPLAIQYLGGTVQQHDELTSYNRVREKWGEFGLNLPISEEAIMNAFYRTANAGELLNEMGDHFDTNALSGSGIMKMMDSIIQETLVKLEDPSQKEKRRVMKRKVRKF